MKWFRQGVIGAVLVLLGARSAALAQAVGEYTLAGAKRAKDLRPPAAPSDITAATTPAMALYKPAGNGPFPALVLLHQCGGRRGNLSMLDWAKEAVARGYVALLLDGLGQRGAERLCQGPQADVFPSRGVRDVLLAAAHLRALPYIDKTKVALVGFS